MGRSERDQRPGVGDQHDGGPVSDRSSAGRHPQEGDRSQAALSIIPPLHRLPAAWRGLLICFVVFLGAGYVVAQLNVLAQNQMIDGEPGLSFEDLKLKYHGGWIERQEGKAAPSRMLEMINGAMREYLQSDEHYEVLVRWLESGAGRMAFEAGAPTPRDVLFTCLDCHSAESDDEIGREAPFGPDLFTVDYDMVSKFTLAAAKEQTHESGLTRVWREPVRWQALVMTAHAHVLSVPIFVALLGGLFLWTGWPKSPAWRTALACAPLVFFLIDLACWWLARLPEAGPIFVGGIAAAGALFGASYGLQWAVVLAALCRRTKAPDGETRAQTRTESRA